MVESERRKGFVVGRQQRPASPPRSPPLQQLDEQLGPLLDTGDPVMRRDAP